MIDVDIKIGRWIDSYKRAEIDRSNDRLLGR